jgi:peptide-methionine (S)-S-oxide reductase
MKKIAVFGMGCFWGPQLLFDKVKGVLRSEVGYMGGKKMASYEEVCTGKTGHAEVIKIEYDANKISYLDLLKVFWSNHDPTQENGQGVDIGNQYRSVVFYFDDGQKKKALASKKELQKKIGSGKKIITHVIKAGKFYRAEDYHQKYLEKKGQIVCAMNTVFAKFFK